MSLRPSILDRYIFREFAMAFFAVMAFCALLLLVARVFDKFGDILQNEPPMRVIILYFATSLPFLLVQIIPVAAMLAVLFGVGGLARNNEIVALMTSGVHSLRLAVPVLFGGLLISGGTFLVSELAIPPLQRAANYYELQLEGKDVVRATSQRQVFARGRDQRYYMMPLFNPIENRMISPVIVDLNIEGSALVQKIEADEATLLPARQADGKTFWELKNPRIWKFDSQSRVTSYEAHPDTAVYELEENLSQILAQQKDPEEMNFRELQAHIQLLAEREQPVKAYETDLFLKIMFPAGIMVVLIIGFSYAIRTRPGTAMTLFGYGIVWAFAYYGLTAVMQAIGHSGTLSPYIAAFLPFAVYAALAAYYMHRSSRWYA